MSFQWNYLSYVGFFQYWIYSKCTAWIWIFLTFKILNLCFVYFVENVIFAIRFWESEQYFLIWENWKNVWKKIFCKKSVWKEKLTTSKISFIKKHCWRCFEENLARTTLLNNTTFSTFNISNSIPQNTEKHDNKSFIQNTLMQRQFKQ